MFSDLDNYLFKQGTHYELYKKLGAHPLPEGGFHVAVWAPHAEEAANGAPVSEETVEKFALAVLEDINPRDSWRAGKAFRQHISVEMARRCLRASILRAGGTL